MADDTGAPFFLPFDEGADSADGPLAFENLANAVAAALANVLDGDTSFSRAKIIAAAEAYLELRDTSAASDLERVWLHTESGTTRLMAVNDDGSVAQTFLTLDHATGAVKLGSVPATGEYFGRVQGRVTNGACTILSGSGGFTVARFGPGQYRVTLAAALPDEPTVHATSAGLNEFGSVDDSTLTTSQFDIRIAYPTGGSYALIDPSSFGFTARA